MSDIARALSANLASAHLQGFMILTFLQTLFCHKLIDSKIGRHSFGFLKDDVLARRLVETRTSFQKAIYIYESPEHCFTAFESGQREDLK